MDISPQLEPQGHVSTEDIPNPPQPFEVVAEFFEEMPNVERYLMEVDVPVKVKGSLTKPLPPAKVYWLDSHFFGPSPLDSTDSPTQRLLVGSPICS